MIVGKFNDNLLGSTCYWLAHEITSFSVQYLKGSGITENISIKKLDYCFSKFFLILHRHSRLVVVQSNGVPAPILFKVIQI